MPAIRSPFSCTGRRAIVKRQGRIPEDKASNFDQTSKAMNERIHQL